MRQIIFNYSTILLTFLMLLVLVTPSRAIPDDPPTSDEPNNDNEPNLELATQNTPANIQALSAAPAIDVWYENEMSFGEIGNPQEHVNIQGNVSDPDGSVASLRYRLNGGSSQSVPIGPDDKRLERAGDFNIAISTSSLQQGTNTVIITARDNTSDIAEKTVTFRYTRGRTWPVPYNTQWSSAASIFQQAQVVDGNWQLSSSGVRPRSGQHGYDRLIALGDIAWRDYEVLVPITIHQFYPSGTDAGGVGIITRWIGHNGPPPLPDDWTRLGAYGYISNRYQALALRVNTSTPAQVDFNFGYGVTYNFRMRAETIPNGGRYSLKVWRQGQPEPSAWMLRQDDVSGDLLQGSVLLVAHRADATFGNVTICQIGGPCGSEPPPPPPPVNLDNQLYIPSVWK